MLQDVVKDIGLGFIPPLGEDEDYLDNQFYDFDNHVLGVPLPPYSASATTTKTENCLQPHIKDTSTTSCGDVKKDVKIDIGESDTGRFGNGKPEQGVVCYDEDMHCVHPLFGIRTSSPSMKK